MIVIFVIHNFLSAVCRCHCCTQRVNNSFFYAFRESRNRQRETEKKNPCRNGKAHGRPQLRYPHLTAMSVFVSDATWIDRLCCNRGYFSV